MRISQDKTCGFHAGRAGFTTGSPDEIPGASVHCHLTRPVGLVSSFCPSRPRFASGFLQTLPCGNAFAFHFPIPFHLGSLGTFIPVTCHAWRTKKPPAEAGGQGGDGRSPHALSRSRTFGARLLSRETAVRFPTLISIASGVSGLLAGPSVRFPVLSLGEASSPDPTCARWHASSRRSGHQPVKFI